MARVVVLVNNGCDFWYLCLNVCLLINRVRGQFILRWLQSFVWTLWLLYNFCWLRWLCWSRSSRRDCYWGLRALLCLRRRHNLRRKCFDWCWQPSSYVVHHLLLCVGTSELSVKLPASSRQQQLNKWLDHIGHLEGFSLSSYHGQILQVLEQLCSSLLMLSGHLVRFRLIHRATIVWRRA